MSDTEPVPEKGPIESKVWAALVGAGSGTAISTFLLWFLGCIGWTHDWSAKGADQAVLAVPAPLSSALLLLITAGLTFMGGYLAKHTPRFDRQAVPDAEPALYQHGELGTPTTITGTGVTPSVREPWREPLAPVEGEDL
jgi:hypothetical protein